MTHDIDPVVAKLGAQVENPLFKDMPTTSVSILNNWYFLGGVIGLMVVILGWCLFRARARLEELPKE